MLKDNQRIQRKSTPLKMLFFNLSELVNGIYGIKNKSTLKLEALKIESKIQRLENA